MMYECLCYASTFNIQYIMVMNSFPILGLDFFFTESTSYRTVSYKEERFLIS
jgi:hypothetical protein